jgi:hypothetical protein
MDFLCGDHSRNLHFDEFLLFFEGYIKTSATLALHINEDP